MLITVGHLTSVHPAFDVRIFYKECITLARVGYDVVLIAPCERDEVLDGVRLSAVPQPRSRSERMMRTIWQVLRTALRKKIDIYHFHDPELIPVGILLKLIGKRVIYDVHENLPENILSKPYIRPRLKKIIASFARVTEYISATCFDGIVAATPSIAKRFPPKKTVIVQNFPVLDDIISLEVPPYSERPPIIAYVGTMTAVRGVKEMVQAMTFIPAVFAAKLVLAGSCDRDLEIEIRQMKAWCHVDFPGWLSQEKVVGLLSCTRVGLVLLHPVGGYVESYPTKMFEYMAAGVPVVASDFPLWREIIVGSGCGILADPRDPKSIATAIQWLLEHPVEAEEMGRKGREVVRARYNWATEAKQLKTFYRALFRDPGH